MHSLKTKHPEETFRELSNISNEGCHTSIYFPFPERRDRTTLKQRLECRLEEARKLLAEVMDSNECEQYLQPFVQAFDRGNPSLVAKGLALFRTPQHFYSAALQLEPPELTVVSDSFHIKPLLQNLIATPHCYVLSITPRCLKVYRVTGHEVDQVQTLQNQEYLGESEAALAFSTRRNTKEASDRFVRAVVKDLNKLLPLHRLSVAILGPKLLRKRLQKELQSKFKTECFFDTTMPSSLHHMADMMQAPMSKRYQTMAHLAAQEAFTKSPGMVSHNLAEIATAAIQGRISSLLIDPSVRIWGKLNRLDGGLVTYDRQQNHTDDCVLDDIVEEIIKREGTVHFIDAIQLGNVAPYIAKFRW